MSLIDGGPRNPSTAASIAASLFDELGMGNELPHVQRSDQANFSETRLEAWEQTAKVL